MTGEWSATYELEIEEASRVAFRHDSCIAADGVALRVEKLGVLEYEVVLGY